MLFFLFFSVLFFSRQLTHFKGDFVLLICYSYAECTISIICACLPDARLFAIRFAHSTLGRPLESITSSLGSKKQLSSVNTNGSSKNQNSTYSSAPQIKDVDSFVQLVEMERRSVWWDKKEQETRITILNSNFHAKCIDHSRSTSLCNM